MNFENLEFDNELQMNEYFRSLKKGKGWSGNQSVNADLANERGEHERSFFNKEILIHRVCRINPNLDVKLLNKIETGVLQSLVLVAVGRHHVGKQFDYHDFWAIGDDAANLTNDDLLKVIEKQAARKAERKAKRAAKAAAPKKIKGNWAFLFGAGYAEECGEHTAFFAKIAAAENVDFNALYNLFDRYAARITSELTVRGVPYPKSSAGIFKTFIYNFSLFVRQGEANLYYGKIAEKVYALLEEFKNDVNNILGGE